MFLQSWQSIIRNIFLLSIFALFYVQNTNAKDLSRNDKVTALNVAVKLARSKVQQALANKKYMAINRPSSVSTGPHDIRELMQGFLENTTLPNKLILRLDSEQMQSFCKPWILAYVRSDQAGFSLDPIYICNGFFDLDVNDQAETILHEYAHHVGYTGVGYGYTVGAEINDLKDYRMECVASEFEAHIQIAAMGLYFGNYFTKSHFCPELDESIPVLIKEISDLF